jgi:WD40 repeat protein
VAKNHQKNGHYRYCFLKISLLLMVPSASCGNNTTIWTNFSNQEPLTVLLGHSRFYSSSKIDISNESCCLVLADLQNSFQFELG